MWKQKFAEARSCVSNEVNSFNLKCSVFSVSVSAVTYHYTQWRCFIALSAPLSAFCPTAATDHFQRQEEGFSPGWSERCWTELVFHWTVTSTTWLLSTTEMSQEIWGSLLIPEKLDAEHPRTRWYFVLSISRTCLEDQETEGLSPHACKARSCLDQLHYIPSL